MAVLPSPDRVAYYRGRLAASAEGCWCPSAPMHGYAVGAAHGMAARTAEEHGVCAGCALCVLLEDLLSLVAALELESGPQSVVNVPHLRS